MRCLKAAGISAYVNALLSRSKQDFSESVSCTTRKMYLLNSSDAMALWVHLSGGW